MKKTRLDVLLTQQGKISTRSQAETYIKLGEVSVDGQVVRKPGLLVDPQKSAVKITAAKKYVSRAALKLASVHEVLKLNFRGRVVLDIGSSTGGFSEYALAEGAAKVIAVEVGTNQMHPSLRVNSKIELHEQTDIRSVEKLSTKVDIVLIDVSFISVRDILPHITKLIPDEAQIVVMLKPQFEAVSEGLKHKGVIKNTRVRRTIFKDFEEWSRANYKIMAKADSLVSGEKGNQERFYLLSILRK